MTYKELHYQGSPLLICNVWDVASAKVAGNLGFQAISTSSGAIAAALGFQDGEKISFQEMYFILERIAKNTTLPLSVDLEAGYADHVPMILEHIGKLTDLGILGINLEDSKVKHSRALQSAEDFSKTLEQIKTHLENQHHPLFLNIRTDTFLLKHPKALEETKKRIQLYANAGADGIFVPALVREEDMREVVSSTQLPVNVMCFPGLADLNMLKAWGVKRISMGDFAFRQMYKQLTQSLEAVKQQQSFEPLFQV